MNFQVENSPDILVILKFGPLFQSLSGLTGAPQAGPPVISHVAPVCNSRRESAKFPRKGRTLVPIQKQRGEWKDFVHWDLAKASVCKLCEVIFFILQSVVHRSMSLRMELRLRRNMKSLGNTMKYLVVVRS